jgi:hypothetical protein
LIAHTVFPGPAAAFCHYILNPKIDENRPLPYKPRQLSSMARLDRAGSFWIGIGPLQGQHRWISPHYRRIASNEPLDGSSAAENDP